MSDYVQVNPDNAGKKVETIPFIDPDDITVTLHRQTTSLGRFRAEDQINASLLIIIAELRALRTLICHETRQDFEESSQL